MQPITAAHLRDAASFMQPSPFSGLQLETEMSIALRDSLARCLAEVANAFASCGHSGPGIYDIPADWQPLAADYGAYYDLARLLMAYGYLDESASGEALPHRNLLNSGELSELLAYFQSSFTCAVHRASINLGQDTLAPDSATPSITITTLSTRFYSQPVLDRLTRWIDLEPENALALVPLDDMQLDTARNNIKQALTALCAWAPSFFTEMSAVIHEIITAKPAGNQRLTFRGASSFALWGAIFVNIEEHPHWWTLLPTLIHETGHQILFGRSRHSPLVLNDPSLRYVSPLRDDPRPIDGIYHAAFVSAREVVALEDCLKNMPASLNIPNQEEIRAFFEATRGASLQAFRGCAAILEQEAQLTELGNDILLELRATLKL